MRHESYTYHWHCSEGGLDLFCYVDLELQLDPENLDVLAITSCYSTVASLQTKEAVFRIGLSQNSEFLEWLAAQYLIQHAANRHNVADDLQQEVRRKFNVEPNGVAA